MTWSFPCRRKAAWPVLSCRQETTGRWISAATAIGPSMRRPVSSGAWMPSMTVLPWHPADERARCITGWPPARSPSSTSSTRWSARPPASAR